MAGGRFSWVKPDVYPLIGVMTLAVSVMSFAMARNVFTNPDVHLSKAHRAEGVPESGKTEERAAAHKSLPFLRPLAGKTARIFN